MITKGKNPPSQSWRFYQNLADHLVTGEKLVITPQWARRPIHILESRQKGIEESFPLGDLPGFLQNFRRAPGDLLKELGNRPT